MTTFILFRGGGDRERNYFIFIENFRM